MNLILKVLHIVLLCALFGANQCFAGQDHSKGKKENCVKAPPLSLRNIPGELFTLEQWRKENSSRFLIISFFQKDCVGCLDEIHLLETLFRDKNSPLVDRASVVLVDEMEDRETAAQFARANDIKFNILADPRGTLKYSYNLKVIPKLVIIDPQGRVFRSWAGAELSSLRTSGKLAEEINALTTDNVSSCKE
ncbi:TlpA disulfide reductase family protein [Bdellovibrionota bacterium FG-2]